MSDRFLGGVPGQGVLRQDDEDGLDYTLEEDADGVWLTVGNLSVWVKRHEDNAGVGVYVEVYRHFKEAEEDPLDTCLVYEGDSEDDEETA